jgi:hypothetical protein
MKETDNNTVLLKKIRELEKILKIANAKTAAFETMIEVAERELKIRIRKKAGTKRSK